MQHYQSIAIEFAIELHGGKDHLIIMNKHKYSINPFINILGILCFTVGLRPVERVGLIPYH